MTVTSMLMFWRPGRTRRAKIPMTAPKMMVPIIAAIISPTLLLHGSCPCCCRAAVRPSRRTLNTFQRAGARWTKECRGHGSGAILPRLRRSAACDKEVPEGGPAAGRSDAEADAPLLGLADLDVAEGGGGDDDLPALVVGEREDGALAERGAHCRSDLGRRLV